MSVLTIISGVPLFSTQKEALEWAKSKGLNGLHTHSYMGVTGYMGGVSHASGSANVVNPPSQNTSSGTSSSSY